VGDGERRRPRLLLALATCGGVGYLPGMPGTWASLAALPLWWLLGQLGPWGYGVFFAGLLAVSLKVTGPAQEYLGRPDHPAIVLDEVVGMLITLAGVPCTWTAGAAGFLIFRVLDILKPFPISWLSHGPSGSLEVVADDVVAGLLARMVLEVVLVFGGGG
jgi:phosphatidylglycerophosphatase A